MKQVVLSLALMALLPFIAAAECSILNQEQVQVGSHRGIKGICSNNRLPVSCIYMEGTGIECDGPGGGFTGYDLETLVFSACNCSIEQERAGEMKRELQIPETAK